jgi:hypothetical protein
MALLSLTLPVVAQSYLVLSNGVTLTTDKEGFLYDFGHFNLPGKISTRGGRFFVSEGKLSSIDNKGFLFEKDFKVDEVKGKGLNYFINDDNELVTIDERGFFYEFKDSKLFKRAVAFGGNFFLTKSEEKRSLDLEIYIVNGSGNYFKMSPEGLKPSDITILGGSFFQTRTGVTYTVSKDGFIISKLLFKIGTIVKSGGNFFIDSDNFLFTVSEDGELHLPELPPELKVSDIVRVGANYFLDSEGRFYSVDQSGNITARKTNHDLRNVRILSF